MKRLIFALMCALVLPQAAGAQTPAGPGAKNDNSSKPIEISSDTLEVDQQKQIAVFTGNVIAIQGDMRLRSNRMDVYYTKKEGAEAAAPKPATPAVPGAGQSAISKIVVEGSVVLATPDESAQGAHGIYQVDQKTLHLTENVILTRGQNILRGTRLDYNLETGRSVILGAGTATIPASNGGRVRGVFVPGDDSTPKPGAKAAPAPAK